MKPEPKPDEARRATALRDVKRQAGAAAKAERARNNAMRLARDVGCSLRDIAEASGIPHVTVGRIIDRVEA